MAESDIVRQRLKCPYHRKQVIKEFEKMLACGRISQSLYDKITSDIRAHAYT